MQPIKNQKHIDSGGCGFFDKQLDHIIRVLLVSQHVLTPQQHAQRRIGHAFLNLAHALPRVLLQKTDTAVKRRAAPHLGATIADFVYFFCYSQHVFGFDPRCQQRLLAVPQLHATDFDWFRP